MGLRIFYLQYNFFLKGRTLARPVSEAKDLNTC